MELIADVFGQFGKKWALVTAGTRENFNTMTISWGGLGTLWGEPVATVYVRLSRYTHQFMENNDYFTVSFYPEEYRKTLAVLGSRSGRDMDKMGASGLTPREAGPSMTFAEAEVTLVCKKLYRSRLELSDLPEDVVRDHYADNVPHDMYIGQVVDIIR